MKLILNYSPEREKDCVAFFSQLPDGGNIATMWKKFGTVHINGTDKIDTIIIKLLHMIDPDELNMIKMQNPMFFPHYKAYIYERGTTIIDLTPKEDIMMPEVTKGTTDTTTTSLIDNEQVNRMRGTPGFIM